ncbi:MAG: carboxypeptidase-like regulatory domain-containing protein, partial [Pyrinomonadaceae bacterium]|nr:carboxypeptidase-like regulatory domain-containing protein [Pyrinomonadaceae bacterium]
MKVIKFFATIVLCVSACAAVFAQAQASTADLTGTVVDPNGAVIQGATITAKNIATGVARTVQTN